MAISDIKSMVIGTVWKVEKSVGDLVNSGETIMVLESMKMEIPIDSPCAGKLVDIAVNQEDSVDEGQILCKVEA